MVAEKGHAAAAWAEAKKPTRPIKSCGLLQSRRGLLWAASPHFKADAAFCVAAALQWPLRPITKPKRSGKKIEVTLLQHSFILLIIDY